jgi:hypothetical protein
MTNKQFDCLEMIEEIQEDIQKELESLSPEEQLAFWRSETEKLRERQRRAQVMPAPDLPNPPNSPP